MTVPHDQGTTRSAGGRWLVSLILALTLISLAPASGLAWQSPSPASPCATAARGDFAGRVDIGGGRKMYLECHGRGTPTVILESGYETMLTSGQPM